MALDVPLVWCWPEDSLRLPLAGGVAGRAKEERRGEVASLSCKEELSFFRDCSRRRDIGAWAAYLCGKHHGLEVLGSAG